MSWSRHRLRRKFPSAAALLALGCSKPLLAQSDAGQTPAPQQLDVVTVTAQKVPQDERDVPLSITVLDGDKLVRGRIRTSDDISRYAANTRFTKYQLYVRGIGTANTFGFDPSVGVFVDGVYLGRATAAVAPFWDLAQVEVIRGPQGTLLGKNTIGGALGLTTADPGQDAAGSAEILGGALDPYGYRGAASIPLGEEWAARLALMGDRSSGYVRNTSRNSDDLERRNQGYRAKLAYRPAGALSGWLSVDSSDTRLIGYAQQLSAVTAETLAFYQGFDPATEADLGNYQAASDTEGTGGRRSGRSGTLSLSYDWDALRFNSLTNVARSHFRYLLDVDYSAAPLITLGTEEGYRQWSQELRVQARWTQLEFIAGAYYYRSQLDVDNGIAALPQGSAALLSNHAGLPPPLAQALQQLAASSPAPDPAADHSRKEFRQHAESGALFAQAVWRFAPDWALTGGLRWTRERKGVHMNQSFERSGLLFSQFLGEEAYDARRQRGESDVSPRLALQWAASPQVSWYAVAARGFKGGGFNDFSPRPDTLEFRPERSQSIEGGFKALLLDRSLGLNLNLFDSRLKDLQVISYAGTSFYVQNAAAVRARGVEIESRWRIGAGWNAHASLGLLDGRYASFPNAPTRANQSTNSQDLSGARLSQASKRSGAAGMEYISAPFGGELVWRANMDALYRSHSYLNLDNDPLDAQPGHIQWNAALGVGSASGRWALRLNGLNLTNRLIRSMASDVPLFSGNHWAEVDPPRRFSAALELAW